MSSGDSDPSAAKSGKQDDRRSDGSDEKAEGFARTRASALSSVGSALGGFARRVSALVGEIGETVTETVTTVTVPEAVRTALSLARQHRADDRSSDAIAALHLALVDRPDELSLQTSLAVSWARALLFEGRVGVDDPERVMGATRDAVPVGVELLRAVLSLLQGEPAQATDPLRRARRLVDKVSAQDRDELKVLVHFTAALVHRALGQRDRAIRELKKSRARLRGRPSAALSERMVRIGAELYLAQDRPFDAESWIVELHELGVQRGEGEATPGGADATSGEANREAEARGSATHKSDSAASAKAPGRGTAAKGQVRAQQIDAVDLSPIARAYLAIAAGVRGDAQRSGSLLSTLPADGEWAWAHARVALVEMRGAAAARYALTAMSVRSEDPETLRLWALSEFAARQEHGELTVTRNPAPRTTTDRPSTEESSESSPPVAGLGPRFVGEVISALMIYADACAPQQRALAWQELAFVALALGCYAQGRIADAAVEQRLHRRLIHPTLSSTTPPLGTPGAVDPQGRGAHEDATEGSPPQVELTNEGVLYAIRYELERGGKIALRWLSREGDDLILPDAHVHEGARTELGLDELSPLRSPARRATLLGAHANAALSIHAQREGRIRIATISAVRALTQDPHVDGARAVLEMLTPRPSDARLESLLGLTTQLLSGLPDEVLGQSFEAPKEALATVIQARERLARPFSIAVMGEFSSGKSSVVNALLGEVIAPMGVLPTTTTINLYRRGPGGGARVHYRDGRLGLLAPGDIAPFLHGLDDVEASRVRYVEIERNASFVGDTTIVDTPGLNALDPYHEKVAREFLAEADAIIWVFSATRGSTASESDIVSELRDDGRSVLGVLNKVDTLRGDEVEELVSYVREQLGDALLDVVPVSAKAAIGYRTAQERATSASADSSPSSPAKGAAVDPFATLESTIAARLIRDGREIKRRLTTRRVLQALGQLRVAVLDRIASLERAGTASRETGREQELEHALTRVSRRSSELIVANAEPLLREWLSAGVFDAAQGVVLAAVDPAEIAYLDALVEDICLDALEQACTQDALGTDARLLVARTVQQHMSVWARGYFVAMRDVGLTKRWLALLSHRGVRSEAGLQTALQELLGDVAAHWATQILSLHRVLLADYAAMARSRDDAPIAEALRLRVIVLGGLDAIRDRLTQGLVQDGADPEASAGVADRDDARPHDQEPTRR